MLAKLPQPIRGPKSRRLAQQRLRHLLIDLYEEGMPWEAQMSVPDAWATLEEDLDVQEKRVKVTLWLDESVAKYFRAMGKGYQARVNRVLATYAQMKIAEVRWFHAERQEVRKQTMTEAGWYGPDAGKYDHEG